MGKARRKARSKVADLWPRYRQVTASFTLDYLCSVAHRQEIFYLWRPVLRDPSDDMILELAVASGSGFIVTFNERDFVGCEAFDIQVVTPRRFLEEIGGV